MLHCFRNFRKIIAPCVFDDQWLAMHRWTRTYTSARSSEILLKGFFF